MWKSPELRREYQRKYRINNPDKVRKWAKDFMAADPNRQKIKNQKARERYARPEYKEIKRGYRYKHRYGITLEDFNKLLDSQGGLCAICFKPEMMKETLSVDHDHETRAIRALLCTNCNLGIGYFQDNIELMNKAIAYINNHKKP